MQTDVDPMSQTTLIPHNQQPLVIRTYPSETQLSKSIERAAAAQEKWARVPLKQRIAVGRQFMVRCASYQKGGGAHRRYRRSLGRCAMRYRWN